ncbi:hypothetical protein [Agrobacterium tumefaciens]|uniref:Lipoprotein n=1 Tax=Agrobacterium tumefaciens TaxID=358 RepID=A0A4D7Z8J5_AGRTU|nr:hypothetical protein [Agrobacterium tumefaciens]QCL98270.1 hypothetical protein CFBP7129_29345 [Agrobacterium tumefaciens]
MRIMKALFWPFALIFPLAACGQHAQSPRMMPPAPYANLGLSACRHYPGNIVECQLDYGTQFGRHRLGPVQQVSRELATNLDGSRYQISTCWPVSRIQRELPNFTCRIYTGASGADAGSVLVKGGTAVRLARILGDRDQILYRWKPDRWSRLQD